MAATSLRITPVAVLAAGTAALIAWALRAHAEFLPTGRIAPHSLLLSASSSHGHGGAEVYRQPPAVAGDALANYAGLAAVAMHVMLIGVALAAWGARRWLYRPAGSLLARVTFAGAVAVTSALITMGMAAVLLGTAISFAAMLAAAVTVLRYAFVFVIVSCVVVGLP